MKAWLGLLVVSVAWPANAGAVDPAPPPLPPLQDAQPVAPAEPQPGWVVSPPAEPAPPVDPTDPGRVIHDNDIVIERRVRSDWQLWRRSSAPLVREELVAVQGRYKKELSWGDFYDAVGQPKLARAWRLLTTTHLLTELAGGLVGGLGTVAMAVGSVLGLALILLPISGLLPTALGLGIRLPPAVLGTGPAQVAPGALVILSGAAIMVVCYLGSALLMMVDGLLPEQVADESDIRRFAEEHNSQHSATVPAP